MLRKDEFVNLIESQVAKDGNKRVAYENVGRKILENIQTGKIRTSDISFKAMMEACLQEAGYGDVMQSYEDTNLEDLREAVSSSSFPNITKYVIQSEMIPPYEAAAKKLDPLYMEIKANRSDSIRIAGFTAKEGVELVPEAGTVQYTSMHEKYVEIFLNKFQRAIGLTKEAIFNDNTGQLISRASDIGYAFGEQFEEYIVQTIELRPRSLRSMETTSNLQCAVFDGTAVTNANFYSTDHSSLAYMGAQTNNNKITSALDTDGLKDAWLLFASMVDEEGTKISVDPKTLLVHKNKTIDALQLTRSVLQYDTANNAINPWGPGGLQTFNVIDTSFINTNTHWYLGDFKKQFVVAWWERPNVTSQGKNSEQSFTNDIVMAWKFSAGFGAGARDYRYVAVSQATT